VPLPHLRREVRIVILRGNAERVEDKLAHNLALGATGRPGEEEAGELLSGAAIAVRLGRASLGVTRRSEGIVATAEQVASQRLVALAAGRDLASSEQRTTRQNLARTILLTSGSKR
jgi:hypothetical protein